MLLLISFLACGDKESDTSSTDTTDTTDTSVDDTDGTDTNDTAEDSTNAESLKVGDIVISERRRRDGLKVKRRNGRL